MGTNLLNSKWQRRRVSEATVLSTTFDLYYYGQTGTLPGKFSNPGGIGFTANGLRLLVADNSNGRVQVFGVTDGVSLTYLSSYGTVGTGDGKYTNPMDVKCHPTTSHVFVADTGNHRIHILKLTGDTLSSVEYFGSQGSGNGQFNSILGIAISRDGTRLAVAEYNNYRIQIFGIDDGTLTHQVSFGGVNGYANGEFYGPRCVAFNHDGTRLAVSEDARVRWLRVDGNTVTNITDFGFVGGGYGRGVQISEDGKLMIIADSGNHRVMFAHIANDKLTRIASIGSGNFVNTTGGELSSPYGAALHPDGVHVAIGDSGNNRIITL